MTDDELVEMLAEVLKAPDSHRFQPALLLKLVLSLAARVKALETVTDDLATDVFFLKD